MSGKGKVFLTLGIIFLVIFLIWGGIRIFSNISFEQNCEGYLKQAGDANTVEMAKKQLEKAIAYMENQGLTEGSTGIIIRTPKKDVGFWYQNVKSALTELNSLKPDAAPLEKSNMLMKLRETLLDDTSDGVKVTTPPGISVFPNNGILCFMAWISGLLCALFFFLFYVEEQ